jgi:hypothetical protein
MWRALIVAVALVFAGCAQVPPSADDSRAKSFDAVPGKSVIYIVRGSVGPGLSDTLYLNDRLQITTWTGTYYRWETEPGAHRIAGFGPTNAMITMRTEPGKVYFVLHRVVGTARDGVQNVVLQELDDKTGRAMVQRARLL